MSTAESTKRDALATLRIPRDDPPRQSFLKRLFRWCLVLAVVAGLGAGGFALARQSGWVGNVSDLVPEAIRSLPEVRVAKVVVERGRAADAVVVATGYLESRRQAMIGARAAGRIEVVNVEEGIKVTEGQVLAVLEHKDMDAALAATKATLARARAEVGEQQVVIARAKRAFERAKRLAQTDSISDEAYDQARYDHEGAVARLASLEAAVKLAEARVTESEQFNENMIIRAPFNGTVISKDAEVGESILPGGMGEASGRGSVVTIADLEHLQVECDVKEDYIGRVIPGAPAEIAVDAVPNRRYDGRVIKVIPMGDRARATIKVEVEILDADGRLFPEMSSTVFFLPEQGVAEEESDAPRVFCDSKALMNSDEGVMVWKLTKENHAEGVAVTVGEDRDGRTEILSGLQGGERLILNPPDEVSEGTLVRIRES